MTNKRDSGHTIFTLMRARATQELFDVAKRMGVPMPIFASACEALALSVRMTSGPDIVAVLDFEYAEIQKKMKQEIAKEEPKQLPQSSLSFSSPEQCAVGRKIIADIFSKPLILDDDDDKDDE